MTHTPNIQPPEETQPKPEQELYRTIMPLTDERRLEARERARAIVVKAAGEQPKREDYDQHTESRYPSWMNWTINGLCLIVLVAAFLPSAFRLFFIGSTTFILTMQDSWAAMITGFSIVIMAELSMVLFSIASVVIESHKIPVPIEGQSRGAWLLNQLARIDSVKILLIVSQLVATGIALVGNAQVSLANGHHENLFAVIEAFSPSIVVFSTSYILKAQMLSSIGRRYANTRAFQSAMNAWSVATSQTDRDPAYRPALANAFRDFLREDNVRGPGATGRKEYMAGLVLADWKRLVYREFQADAWYSDPDVSIVVHPARSSAVQMNGQMNGYPSVQAASVRPLYGADERMNEYSGQPLSIRPLYSADGRADGYPVQRSEFAPDAYPRDQRMTTADGQHPSTRSHGTGSDYSKNMSSREIALAFFARHREYLYSNHTLDQLEPIVIEKMGQKAGRTVLGNVRKELRAQQPESNGHIQG